MLVSGTNMCHVGMATMTMGCGGQVIAQSLLLLWHEVSLILVSLSRDLILMGVIHQTVSGPICA